MDRKRFIRAAIIAALLYPYFAFSARAQRRFLNADRPRILVVPQLTRIGDLVCATPVFRAIKEKYPRAYLGVAISKKSAGIIKNNPRTDEIFYIEDADFLRKIKARRFDYGFALTASPLPSPFFLLASIPRRIKTIVAPRSVAEICTDWMNTGRVRYEHHTYLPRHYLKLLEVMGIHNPDEKKEVWQTEEGKRKTKELLQTHGISRNDCIVGISVTAGNIVKEWPRERFAELADWLITERRAFIFFIGSAADETALKETQTMLKNPMRSAIITDFTIEELPALLAFLKLFISVDTGLAYIADALGIPLVDISGPCDTREQPPQGKHAICVAPPGKKPTSFVMKSPGSWDERRAAVLAVSALMVKNAILSLHENNLYHQL